MYKKIIILLISINSIFATNYNVTDKTCKTLLHELADKHHLYIYCATIHAVPIEICQSCKLSYTDIVDQYKILRDECFKEFFDNDRINIIETTQTTLVGLWNRAYCDDCFIGNNSQIFVEQHSDVLKCFNDHTKNVCTACFPIYNSLNVLYHLMDEKSKSHVCFDIQDAMNRTRATWSKDFGCGKRNRELTAFICAAVAGLSVPLLFYLVLFIIGKRQENNHGLLNEEADIETNNETNTIAVNNAVAPTPSTVAATSSNEAN